MDDTGPDGRARHALRAGTLHLRVERGDPAALFRVAERINPKRAFLFVSTVLGRHIPALPRDHRAALTDLAARVSPRLGPGPVLVMGFAETAVGIGAGVFDALRARHPAREMGYLTTTRFGVPGHPVWFEMREEHSHAADHTVLVPHPGVVRDGADATLVLVDDETTTGSTFAALAGALAAQGLRFGRVVAATLTDWSAGEAARRLRVAFPGAAVEAVSLLEGTWRWEPDAGAAPVAPPPPLPARCPVWHPAADRPFAAPRLGLSTEAPREDGATLLARLYDAGLAPPAPGARVLVIGAGEHVWQPFLVAEALADRGTETKLIATTRSPVMQGATIARKLTFADHYGLGIAMYLHNVDPRDWDRLWLFTETGIAGIGPDLRRALPRAEIVDGDGAVHHLA